MNDEKLPDLVRPRSRSVLLISLLIVIGFGLASRKFSDVLPSLIADHAGDALWTVAVYLALAILLPRKSPRVLVVAALGISFAVELSQLAQFEWLLSLRKTMPGRLLLGSGFVWFDFVRYSIGAAIVFLLDWLCARYFGLGRNIDGAQT